MLDWILSTDQWPARAICGAWSDAQIVWHQTCGVIISLCYLIIPTQLSFLFRRMLDIDAAGMRTTGLQHPWLCLILAAMFVAGCGMSHLTGDVIVFYYPAYNLHGVALSVTSIASISMVLALSYELWRK